MTRDVADRTAYLRYASDLIALALSLWVARLLRLALPWGQALDAVGVTITPMLVFAVIIWTATHSSLHTYHRVRTANSLEEAQAVASAVVVSTLLYAGVLYLSYRGLSRLLFLYFGVCDLLLSLGGRAAIRQLGHSPGARRQILVIGARQMGHDVTKALCSHVGADTIVGYLHDDTEPQPGLDGVELLGHASQAGEIIERLGVHEVVLALPPEEHARLGDWIAKLQAYPVRIQVVADYARLVLSRSEVQSVGDLVLVGLNEPVIGPIDRLVKRVFDLAISLCAGILLMPVLGLIALWVQLDSPGPILYRSGRVREGNRLFRMLKFRTMMLGAEADEGALISESPQGQVVFAKSPGDPRITRAGRTLRRWSLDELPQLWNVIVGEMSLVGPRPELPSLVARYLPWQRRRFSVPQGMTGWWQISARSDAAKHLHVEDDLYYIRNYSLLLDLVIIWRTFGAVIRGRGAY